MKKLIYSLIAVVFCTTAIIAKTITSDVAQTVAANFFKQNAGVQVKTLSLVYTETSSPGDSVYFVYNINPPKGGTSAGAGFVIVVADDAQYPVIGYSTEGSFVVPEPSSNAGYWMEQRKIEIIANKEQHIKATEEISAQWKVYLSSQIFAPRVASTVSPLVQTLWDQPSPYNALCPGGSLTGCVATAMAQIMRYWKWPVKGTGSSSYNCPGYGTLSANYGNTTYNLSNMPTGTVNSANNDVATLMYQCGVSVEMDYAPSGSASSVTIYDNPGACSQISYSKYFGYDVRTIKNLERFDYTDQNWINIIENELNAGRPLQYNGLNPSDGIGHDWVCDGYDANNYLHMNWGFSGSNNGYYSINLLNPGSYNYPAEHSVLIGIEPKMSVPNDAGILSVTSPGITICSSSVTPIVQLQNFGTSALTSCTINYYIDANATQTYSWTGSLAASQSVNVTLPGMTVNSQGAHSFTSFTSNPNSAADGNPANDQSTGGSFFWDQGTLPMSQGFETNTFLPTGWSTWNSNDTVGTLWQITNTVAHTGNNCIFINDFFATRRIGTKERFITMPYNFSSETNVSLSFAVAYAVNNYSGQSYSDVLVVYYSVNCGATWTQCYTKGGTALATAPPFNGATITSPWMPASASQWRTDVVNLNNLSGQQSVMLAFEERSGWGGWLYLDDINLSGVTGIASIPADELFSIYPNPASNQLTIHTPSSFSASATVSIINVLGEVVRTLPMSLLEREGEDAAIDIHNLPAGMYFLQMKSENGNDTKRFVKE